MTCSDREAADCDDHSERDAQRKPEPCEAVELEGIHAKALGPGSSRPSTTMNAAIRTSTPFRARVFQPVGAEWSCPKQWQSGAFPRAIAIAMAAQNTRSRANAATAAHQRVAVGRRSKAMAISARGSPYATGRTSLAGTPKVLAAICEPPRSRSFANPATAKTAPSIAAATISMMLPAVMGFPSDSAGIGRPCRRNRGRSSCFHSGPPLGSPRHRSGSVPFRSRCWVSCRVGA